MEKLIYGHPCIELPAGRTELTIEMLRTGNILVSTSPAPTTLVIPLAVAQALSPGRTGSVFVQRAGDGYLIVVPEVGVVLHGVPEVIDTFAPVLILMECAVKNHASN